MSTGERMRRRIDVFNPYAETIRGLGFEEILGNTEKYPLPFLQILGARWLAAQLNDETSGTFTCSLPEQCEARVIVMPDFFLSDFITRFGGIEEIRLLDKKVVVFSDLPAPPSPWHHRAAMNRFLSSRSGAYSGKLGFHYQAFNSDDSGVSSVIPVIPMGCGQNWLPAVQHSDKVIFLDEPHETLLAELGNKDDIRVALLMHSLETCRALSEKGYEVITFSRESAHSSANLYKNYEFLRLLRIGSWIPFSMLMSYYAQASLFFSFFTETHGYPIYENMQLGNGVITYAETFDAFRLRPMQRGVLLSVYNSPRVCAEIVDEYYERYKSNGLRAYIREEAKELFSVETFFCRLRKSELFEFICNS